MIGFKELLLKINEKWQNSREELLRSSDSIAEAFNREKSEQVKADAGIISEAIELYRQSYDSKFGGFGKAPKFPAAHNLLFLMKHYEKSGDRQSLKMAEHTLIQLYRGGIFDHIGYGFSRYSTDRYYLVPHFEKMLYDNALLIMAYCKAFWLTEKEFYREIAEKTARFILREMTSPEGGFYSAQDADSEGSEGKYYVFEPEEIEAVIGKKEAQEFNRHYSITRDGNFEGKSIPNLLNSVDYHGGFEAYLPEIYEYRKNRYTLHLDDKILTSWNSLMIAAMCWLGRAARGDKFLSAAVMAQKFIENNLCHGNTLFVSFRNGKHGQRGFLDDYANYVFALIELYGASLEQEYLNKAEKFLQKAISDFFDQKNGGFYLSGKDNETLIMRPKECYDGAVPSGNSVMAYNIVRLYQLTGDKSLEPVLKKQLDFMSGEAAAYPAGYSMFVCALYDYVEPPAEVTVVCREKDDIKNIPFIVPPECAVKVLYGQTDQYRYINNKTTYYICKNHMCLPPSNDLAGVYDKL